MLVAKSLGLSRTPVREAIKRLTIEGFVSRSPGEGLRVVGLGPDEIEQIFHVRLMLETYAARRAALYATDEQIAELQGLAKAALSRTPAANDQDIQYLSDCNARFHRLIMEAAQSPRITGMLSSAMDLGLVLRTYRMYSKSELIRSSYHHQEISDAITARAPEWAASVMSAHLHAAFSVAMGDGQQNSPAQAG
jgi:DNA-binding GntR family transcriptional regulator